MGLRDRVRIPDQQKQAAFLDAPGLYELQILSIGQFESQKDGTEYWKLSAIVTERDPEPPKGHRGEYSPLQEGDEVVVIHNLNKDKWGYSRKEREEIQRALGSVELEAAAGLRLVVEIHPKETQRGRVMYVRSWYGVQQQSSDDTMPF